MMIMSRRVRSWTALAVVVVLVAALSAIATIPPSALSWAADGGWGTDDPTAPTGGTQLPSGTVSSDLGTVHWEVGYYDSDSLHIYGLICYPVAAGRHPVLIISHGLDVS